jgi:hypothetical protein
MKRNSEDDDLKRFHYRVFYECALRVSNGSKKAAKALFTKIRGHYDGLMMFYPMRSYVKRSTLHYFNL